MILVPQGAEYGAVCRGLRGVSGPVPAVISLPMGLGAVQNYLAQASGLPGGAALLMGLGGGLTPGWQRGQAILARECLALSANQPYLLDPGLNDWILGRLASQVRLGRVRLGRVVSCDRILQTPDDKHQVAQASQAQVVDMESSAVIQAWAPQPIAILRVISDDVNQPLPNLGAAVGADGQLTPLPLTWSFLKQPVAAAHLIRSSLLGLQQLQRLTTQLFTSTPDPVTDGHSQTP